MAAPPPDKPAASLRPANGPGNQAAADGLAELPRAWLISRTAAAASWPRTSSVSSVSAAGSTLTVISVKAAKVPKEPVSTLHRS